VGKLLVDNRPGETAVGPQGPAGLPGPTTEYFDNGVTLGNFSKINFVGSGITLSEGPAGVLNLQPPDSSGIVLTDITCDSSVFVGAFVRMDSSGVALNALADSMANSNVIGLVESKQSSTKCTLRLSGKSNELYTGLDPTKDYYLSTTLAGQLQDTPPVASGTVMLKVGQPFSATSFVISKGDRVQRS
jgi:hypothetical protein